MGWYVTVTRINGRYEWISISDWCHSRGLDVKYNPGGWSDNDIETVAPHIKFNNREDALAYWLAHGGDFTDTIPHR